MILKQVLKILFLFFICLFHNCDLKAQQNEIEYRLETKWSVFWNSSYRLESNVLNKNKFTAKGIGIKLLKELSPSTGIEIKLSYRNWSDFRETIIPLTIGPSFTFFSNQNNAFMLRGGVGPHGILGNDYAGFFAGFEIGPEAHLKLGNNALIIALALAQSSSFHPSSFEYLDMNLGIRF
ncbi:MAG: hypothetical protein HKO66_09810 [Saprospiraceae bacterium]|nr:hypothetical protein [Bacteroidia bacterium]NNL92515.1 hypothetical protein [Saprospiraceae bacterium]